MLPQALQQRSALRQRGPAAGWRERQPLVLRDRGCDSLEAKGLVLLGAIAGRGPACSFSNRP